MCAIRVTHMCAHMQCESLAACAHMCAHMQCESLAACAHMCAHMQCESLAACAHSCTNKLLVSGPIVECHVLTVCGSLLFCSRRYSTPTY